MVTKIIPYGRQWIDNTDINGVKNVLSSDWLTQGPSITEFENKIAHISHVKYAVACSNGTAALHLACLASGIKTGDEVLVPSLTFVASANCVVYCGGKPILCDIDSETLTIDPKEITKKITPKTKAIIAVDFAGHPANWDKLKEIAKKHKLILIDDAAHALGAKYKKVPIGSQANLTTFSFHPVKTITTGEGGIILTNDNKLADRLRLFRTHGIRKIPDHPGWYQEMIGLGFNYRITDLQATLGLSQLKKLPRFLNRRRQIAHKYMTAFRNHSEIILPPNKNWAQHAWHIFPIQFKTRNRDLIYNQLREMGVGSQVHYMPIHLQPYYMKKFNYQNGDFPKTEKYFSRCLTIPLFPKMTDRMVNKVINAVLKTIK